MGGCDSVCLGRIDDFEKVKSDDDDIDINQIQHNTSLSHIFFNLNSRSNDQMYIRDMTDSVMV